MILQWHFWGHPVWWYDITPGKCETSTGSRIMQHLAILRYKLYINNNNNNNKLIIIIYGKELDHTTLRYSWTVTIVILLNQRLLWLVESLLCTFSHQIPQLHGQQKVQFRLQVVRTQRSTGIQTSFPPGQVPRTCPAESSTSDIPLFFSCDESWVLCYC